MLKIAKLTKLCKSYFQQMETQHLLSAQNSGLEMGGTVMSYTLMTFHHGQLKKWYVCATVGASLI